MSHPEWGDEGARTYVKSVNSLRETMWCCLSCGMPFTYPEDAYDRREKHTTDLVKVSRILRIGMADPDAPYTQWNPTRCPLYETTTTTTEEDPSVGFEGRFKGAWVALRSALHNGNTKKNQAKKLEKDFLDKKVLLCEGCAAVSATVVLPNKIPAEKSSSLNPDKTNTEWLLCFVASFYISSLIIQKISGTRPRTEQRDWKRECLVRLHMGFLVYTLGLAASSSDPAAAGSFEEWYMYTFHPLVEWENIKGLTTLGMADSTYLSRAGSANYGSLDSSKLQKTLADTIYRVQQVCLDYPFVLPGGSQLGDGAYFFSQAMTSEMRTLLRDTRIPWAPLGVSYGLRGDLMLDRLRISSKVREREMVKVSFRDILTHLVKQGKFQSDVFMLRKFLEYLEKSAGANLEY